jgi:uncharacterized protein
VGAVTVEVVYALPERAALACVEVPAGATLREAIERSGLLQRFPEIDLGRNRVGVFGRLRALEEQVADGDRLEIYRPLAADPKEQRRRRARKG